MNLVQIMDCCVLKPIRLLNGGSNPPVGYFENLFYRRYEMNLHLLEIKAKLETLIGDTEIAIKNILNSNDTSLNQLGATENLLEELKIGLSNFK